MAMSELGIKWKVMSPLSGTLYTNVIFTSLGMSHLFAILPTSKKRNEQPCSTTRPQRTSATREIAFTILWEGPLSHHPQAEKASFWLTFPCVLQSPAEDDPESAVMTRAEVAVTAAGQDP